MVRQVRCGRIGDAGVAMDDVIMRRQCNENEIYRAFTYECDDWVPSSDSFRDCYSQSASNAPASICAAEPVGQVDLCD